MHDDGLGRVAGGQGLLDPVASEAVAGDAPDRGAGGAAGGPPGFGGPTQPPAPRTGVADSVNA
ncbi:hypothetical protein SGFS_001670 [Streptomyces graminofaciens]|uniref:Uncharacterized protein n=1 Tax=Streptomyces graminofaciens TaxID=68212 RepID=A0ABN5V6V5_9ACTN|nr:hypothetical protein SGFS_001670 [Streptomyces graminofaciens]